MAPNGYGRAWDRGRRRVDWAHRVVYRLHRGPIPAGLHLDHTCHPVDGSCPGGRACPHRACVNPDHLVPVTQEQNKARRVLTFRTGVCMAGLHDVTDPAAVYVHGDGARECRACRNARNSAWRARQVTT